MAMYINNVDYYQPDKSKVLSPEKISIIAIIFKPKQSGEFNYKTLLNKETWMTMPSGTPGFYFSIGGNLETALFDTGSLINVVDPPTADKIGIEKYPQLRIFSVFQAI